MINRVILVGRLTRDPEMRKTQNGNSVVSYTLAVDRTFKSPGQPECDFISCVAWSKTAELMAQYLHKGSLIGVEGRIQTRNYENQQGQRVYVTEVVTDNFQFLEPKGARSGYGQSYDQGGYSQGGYNQNGYGQSGGYSQNNYGQGGGYGQGGYGNQSSNPYQNPNPAPYSSNAGSNSGYQAPVNPMAQNQDSGNMNSMDDDDQYDIASDDLPF